MHEAVPAVPMSLRDMHGDARGQLSQHPQNVLLQSKWVLH